MNRRRFLADGGKAALALASLRAPRVEAAPAFDLVIHGGTVLDGTGAAAFAADLGIVGDTIAALDRIPPEQGRRALDARGLHVVPGFIDIHSHSDFSLPAYPAAESRVRQGVTTEITGNCGSSAAPLGTNSEDGISMQQDGIQVDWSDVAGYCAHIEKTRIAVNQALLIGQGTLREIAIGIVDRPVSASAASPAPGWRSRT